jgi:hypothetical protein
MLVYQSIIEFVWSLVTLVLICLHDYTVTKRNAHGWSTGPADCRRPVEDGGTSTWLCSHSSWQWTLKCRQSDKISLQLSSSQAVSPNVIL